MRIKHQSVTTTKHHATLDRYAILTLVRESGHEIPNDARLFVEVPGSGECDIDNEVPVQIRWESVNYD